MVTVVCNTISADHAGPMIVTNKLPTYRGKWIKSYFRIETTHSLLVPQPMEVSVLMQRT